MMDLVNTGKNGNVSCKYLDTDLFQSCSLQLKVCLIYIEISVVYGDRVMKYEICFGEGVKELVMELLQI